MKKPLLPTDFESPNGDYSQSVERFHAFRHTVPVSFGRTCELLTHLKVGFARGIAFSSEPEHGQDWVASRICPNKVLQEKLKSGHFKLK